MDATLRYRLRHGPARVVRAALLVIAAGLATIQLQALVRTLSPPGAYLKDFSQEYLLARALWDGVDTNLPIDALAQRYATDIGFLNKVNPTPHPPTAGLFGLPFAAAPYVPSVTAWTVLQLACLVASVMLLIRAMGLPPGARHALLASFLLVIWPPIGLDLGIAQLTLPLLAMLAAAEVALLRGRSKVGGAFLGASLLLKPLAWPWALVLLRRRDWPALVTMLGTVVIGYTAVAVREGLAPIAEYFFHVLPDWNTGYLREPTNLSPARLGQVLFADQPLLAQIVSMAVVAIALAFVWWSAAPRRPLRFALGIATAAALVANPVVWEFYFVLALLPIANAVSVLRTHLDPLTTAALVAVLVLPFVGDVLGPRPDHTAYFIVGLSAAACTLLLAVATLRAQEITETPSARGGSIVFGQAEPVKGVRAETQEVG
jgi:hypothetical protein